jgi:hypothetical protein
MEFASGKRVALGEDSTLDPSLVSASLPPALPITCSTPLSGLQGKDGPISALGS